MSFGVRVVGLVFAGRCAALRLPERSGGSRKAALRELHRRLVVQRRMRSMVVVAMAMLFAEHFCFHQPAEQLAIEELIVKAGA